MHWWTDPDSLTPLLTAERLAEVVAHAGKEGPFEALPGEVPVFVGTVWHLPMRVSLLPVAGPGSGPVMRIESFYDIGPDGGPDHAPDLTDDPAGLRAALQETAERRWLATIRLVRLGERHALHSLSWTPMAAGIHTDQLVPTFGVAGGSTAGPLHGLAEEHHLPRALSVTGADAAAAAWAAFDAALGPSGETLPAPGGLA